MTHCVPKSICDSSINLTKINKKIFDLRQNYKKMQTELCMSRQGQLKTEGANVSLEQC